jgi:hypothetical protein
MGSSFSTEEKTIWIRDIQDETIKEKTEKHIKELIEKDIGIPCFQVYRWYKEINPKNKNERYCLDQFTLVKIMKQLTTEPYVISYRNNLYWNVSFIQMTSLT